MANGGHVDGIITLGQMQAKGMTMLEVACRKCRRRGRLSIARLIAEYGADDHGNLRAAIAHDCSRMQKPSASIYARGRADLGSALLFRPEQLGWRAWLWVERQRRLEPIEALYALAACLIQLFLGQALCTV